MAQELRHVATSDVTPTITLVHIKSPDVAPHVHDRDDQWDNTFHSICSKLPEKDRLLLLQNQRPFTSTQLYDEIRPRIKKYTEHGFQKFISAIDPVLSHINSFTGIINSFVQSHPEISGLVWGSLYLLITVGITPACSSFGSNSDSRLVKLAGRAQKTLELIVDFLWRTSPDLAVFRKWRGLFPERDFREVSETIRNVYEEVIYFCLDAARFLKRSPVGE
ncbi:MAG: hypothetical protein Q9221_007851 [Calogaya cf. arnoldii]